MRHETRHMTVPETGATTLTAAGALTWTSAERYIDKTIQVTIDGAGECIARIEGTIDGTVWCKLGSDIAASTMRYVVESVTSLRVVVSDVVGQISVTATFAGFDPRTGD